MGEGNLVVGSRSWSCVPRSVTRPRRHPCRRLTNSGWSRAGCMGDRYCRGILPGFESASVSSLALPANAPYLPGRTCSLRAAIGESLRTEIRLQASYRQSRPLHVQNLKVLDPVNRYHNNVRVSHQLQARNRNGLLNPSTRSGSLGPARPVLQTLTVVPFRVRLKYDRG